MITPPTPTKTRTTPASGCGEVVRTQSGQRLRVPGAPGLVATEPDQETVVVTVSVGGGQRRCVSRYARISLNDNDSGAPGFSYVYRLRGRRLRVSLERSKFGSLEVDVATATLLTVRGVSSRSVTVRIGE